MDNREIDQLNTVTSANDIEQVQDDIQPCSSASASSNEVSFDNDKDEETESLISSKQTVESLVSNTNPHSEKSHGNSRNEFNPNNQVKLLIEESDEDNEDADLVSNFQYDTEERNETLQAQQQLEREQEQPQQHQCMNNEEFDEELSRRELYLTMQPLNDPIPLMGSESPAPPAIPSEPVSISTESSMTTSNILYGISTRMRSQTSTSTIEVSQLIGQDISSENKLGTVANESNIVCHFKPKSCIHFNHLIEKYYNKNVSTGTKNNLNTIIGSYEPHIKLTNLFMAFESYQSTMFLPFDEIYKFEGAQTQMMNINQENLINKYELKNDMSSSDEFYICLLCSHVLYEPITLICGCSYCHKCLDEYNSMLTTASKRLNQSDADDKKETNKLPLYPCYWCDMAHIHNTSDDLKVNVYISKLIDKLWPKDLDIRQLRNDIRRFVCYEMEIFDKFNLEKYEFLYHEVFLLDPTNHLVLVDLFMLNYFCGSLGNCLKYANMIVELKPNWPFSFFLKALFYQRIGDTNNFQTNLIICYKLIPSVEHAKYLLSQFKKSSILKFLETSRASNQTSNDIEKTKAVKRSHSVIKESNQSSSIKKIHKLDEKTSNEVSENDSNDESSLSSCDKTVCEQMRSSLASTDSLSETSSLFGDFDELKKLITLNIELINKTDLECSLCYRLILKPVSTPCGHEFCCSCLERSLDHQDKCPLCKCSLAEYLAERRQSSTSFTDRLIKLYFPLDYEERKKQYEDELKEVGNDNEIPIFVCTLALPKAPCPLHIYEPRYRLMLRRAIETGSNEFGMCMYSERSQYRFKEYGCMLKICSYQFSRDGRAIVTTVGGRRFKVLNTKTKDGYNVAEVEWIKDQQVENEEELNELKVLHDEVYQLATKWYSYIPQIQKQRILHIYGMNTVPLPEENIQSNDDGPEWHWFILNILPLENDFQYRFITKTSLKERLNQMKKIILVLLHAIEKKSESSSSKSSHSSNESLSTNRDTNVTSNDHTTM